MGKSKKKKNADFQKVKLKVGKRLPKRSNETNVSFKSRTLKVTQTFRDHSKTGNEAQTKRKLTIKDLKQQCSANKSCSQRLTALEGFKELLISDDGKDAVLSNLVSIMEKVSGLLADPEHTVRQAALRFCKTVFAQITSEQQGFFDYMSAQLCCAMNNISDDVRRDALVMFDLLLEKYPRRVIGAYSNLVPTLIGQISSQMMSGSKVMTLLCNPNSRLSSQQWRAQVLQRLTRIVETFVEWHRELEAPREDEAEVFLSGDQFPVTRGPTVRPCVRNMWSQPYQQKYERKFNARRQEYADLTRSETCLQKFISSLMPLIKQCWVEEYCSDSTVANLHSSATTGRELKEESLPMVSCLVGLLHAFVECWHCVYLHTGKLSQQNCWFRGTFLQYIKDLLLPKFPVYVVEKARKPRKGSPASQTQSSHEVSLLKLNLQVCEALAGFPPKDPGWPESYVPSEDWHKVIVTFLLKNLKTCEGAELSKRATSVLHRVFFHFPATGKQDKLLARALKYFTRVHPLSTEMKVYLQLFEDMAFDLHYQSPYHAVYNNKHELLQPYFDSLPSLLLRLRGVKNGEALACQLTRTMCRHRGKLLTEALHKHMTQLLDVEKGVFAALPESCHTDMVFAIRWAYHDQPAPENVLELVELVCRLPQVRKETADRLVGALNSTYKSLFMKKEFLECKTYYLRFFFTLLVGHKRAELELFHSASALMSGGLTELLWNAKGQQMEKHAFLVKKYKSFFGPFLEDPPTLLHGSQVLEVMADTWTNKMLNKYRTLSPFTAYAALAHWTAMLSPLESYGDFIHCDSAPTPPHIRGEQCQAMMQRRLGEMLPLLKAKMRPFSKLAFSVVYGIVSMETGEEAVTVDKTVVTLMWGAVMDVLRQSLRVLLDLCCVAASFVQGEGSDEESMKAVMVMTKILSSPELSDLKITYQDTIKQQVQEFMAAVKGATTHFEDTTWWQDFLKAPL